MTPSKVNTTLAGKRFEVLFPKMTCALGGDYPIVVLSVARKSDGVKVVVMDRLRYVDSVRIGAVKS